MSSNISNIKINTKEKMSRFFKNVKLVLYNFAIWSEDKMESICSTIFYLFTFYLIVFSIYFGIKSFYNIYEIVKNLFLDNNQLVKLDLLSTNCLFDGIYNEKFTNRNSNLIENFSSNEHISYDLNTNEDIKTVNGIPVKYYNKYIKKYLDLIISRFLLAIKL